jgi:hypothetical protein
VADDNQQRYRGVGLALQPRLGPAQVAAPIRLADHVPSQRAAEQRRRGDGRP